jgi:hypothetical protein
VKLNGEKVSAACQEIVVIPRQDQKLVFRANAVLDYTPFDKLCPEPSPPKRMLPGGVEQENIEHPTYMKAMDEWAKAKTSWMIVESLKGTEGLEWETVKGNEPSTWDNYKDELSEAGLSAAEINRIVGCVISACGLDQAKIDEATEAFLAEMANPDA